jgi:transcriptional regulator with XRE-family HTH domain
VVGFSPGCVNGKRTKTATTEEFGRRVRTARSGAGIGSQERLAELSGLHRTYIGHVERGEVNIALMNIVRISEALGVDPGDLMKGLRSGGVST